MSNKLSWNIRQECASIADCYDSRVKQSKKAKPIVLSGYARVVLLNIVRVVGTALTVVAVLWIAQINLGIAIILCVAMCALIGWVETKIKEASS